MVGSWVSLLLRNKPVSSLNFYRGHLLSSRINPRRESRHNDVFKKRKQVKENGAEPNI